MLVVLPEEGRFEEVEGRFGADFLDEVDEKRRPNAFAKLTMPRFDFKTDLELIKSLTSMGMMAPFGSGADFASITKEAELFTGDALHRANITVDEKGTEAAAATLLGMPTSGSPAPAEMNVDRPFLFAITERETGTVLFLGRVTEPNQGNLCQESSGRKGSAWRK